MTDFYARDIEGAPTELSLIDETDSVTVGIDVRDTSVRLSVGVRLSSDDVRRLYQRLSSLVVQRGW